MLRAHTRLPFIGLALAAGALALSGCAAASEPSASCEDVLAQASYEVMAQLAAGGHATDPAGLRAATTGEVVDDDAPEVTLPSYEVFTTEYLDAEQATLRSALTSASVGVGAVYDEQALYASMAVSGVCAGRLP